MDLSLISKQLEDTVAFGSDIAKIIQGNAIVILLSGTLGVGKTALVKSICSKLGTFDTVTSPTYTLVNVYNSRKIPIVHCDFYRLKTEYEVNGLGLDLYLGDAIIIVEWGDKFPEYFDEYLHISIDLSPDLSERRTITIKTDKLDYKNKQKFDSAFRKKQI